ncbi:MAG TPA: queuosine precursor transporter [Sphingobium sp.]|uniref:queuosine precursor transporter n=1 Tax=Sphingobium sp. TaxID=1912891 RepID=UPI002ED0CB18
MSMKPVHVDAASLAGRPMRYYDFALAAFVTILLLSNLIGAAKLSIVHGFVFGSGILFFPIGYVLGDVLTEVYGYARARRCVWAGFFAMLFMAVMSAVVVAMPAFGQWGCSASADPAFAAVVKASSPGAVCQATYESVFGSTWRIVGASIAAFWAGEFVNSYVLAKMKVWTQGKALWARIWGSTIVGEGVDSLIFYPLAFLGVWSHGQVLMVLVTNWGLKVFWEVVLTPVTYMVIGFLKRREGIDIFDEKTNFSPFKTET